MPSLSLALAIVGSWTKKTHVSLVGDSERQTAHKSPKTDCPKQITHVCNGLAGFITSRLFSLTERASDNLQISQNSAAVCQQDQTGSNTTYLRWFIVSFRINICLYCACLV